MRAPLYVRRYSRALLVTGAAAAAAYAAIQGGSLMLDVRQITVTVNAASADTSFSLVRATTKGTATGPLPFLTQSSQDAAPGATIATAWSVAPTYTAANTFRRMTFLTGVTASVTWSFEPGEMQVRGGGKAEALLLVNHGAGASGNIELMVSVDEETNGQA